MTRKVRISLDAMGGDFGPAVVIPGAAIALERHPDSTFVIHGQRQTAFRCSISTQRSKPLRHFTTPKLPSAWTTSRARRCARAAASRRMWRAIEAVKKGEADVAVSAGNTGALMAMAKFCLRTMAGSRPAGDRRDLADDARREHRAGRRRHHRRGCRASSSTSPSWARPWRGSSSTSSGRPSGCSISASRRSRASRR